MGDTADQDNNGSGQVPTNNPQAAAAAALLPPPILPPTMTMTQNVADFVVHHTWSIRTISAFVVPIDVASGFASMEDGMTLFLRNQQRLAGGGAGGGEGEEDKNNNDDHHDDDLHDEDGSYVRVFYGELLSPKQEEESTSSNSNNNSSNNHNKTQQRQLHLIMDIRTQDEPSAQLIGCFPTFQQQQLEGNDNSSSNNASSIIQSFDYLLTRGSQRSISAALGWLETVTGCVVAKTPIRPTVVDIASAMTLWTSEFADLNSNSNSKSESNNKKNPTISGKKHGLDEEGSENGNGESTIHNDKEINKNNNNKPLTLTYAVPKEFANSGLETLSLTIPPVALMRLCKDILQARNNENGKGKVKGSSGQNDQQNQQSISDDDNYNVDDNNLKLQLPIVKGLQCFLRETFRIHIESFSLIHGSCVAAVLGCDGRCKPLNVELLGSVLREVQFIVQQQQQ